MGAHVGRPHARHYCWYPSLSAKFWSIDVAGNTEAPSHIVAFSIADTTASAYPRQVLRHLVHR